MTHRILGWKLQHMLQTWEELHEEALGLDFGPKPDKGILETYPCNGNLISL